MGLLEYLSGTPGVGHVVAAAYALSGDDDAAGEALNAANRTTVVMVGGGLGALAGPAGMVAGSYAAGALYDCGHTIYTRKYQGLLIKVDKMIKSYDNNDFSGGLTSAVDAGIYVGTDILTGWGGGTIAGNLSKSTSKSVAKNATANAMRRNLSTSVQAMKLLRYNTSSRPNRANRSLCDSPDNASSSSSDEELDSDLELDSSSCKPGPSNRISSTPRYSGKSYQRDELNCEDEFVGGSGSEPPEDNRQKLKKEHEVEEAPRSEPRSLFAQFFEVFLVEKLTDICINGVYLFKEIDTKNRTAKARKDSLKTLIKKMIKNNCLKWAMELVLSVMETMMHPSDVTFVNFLNLSELVTEYLTERLAGRHNEMKRSSHGQNDRRPPFKERKQYYLELVSPVIIYPRFLEVVSAEIFGYASPYDLPTILRHLKLEIAHLNHMSPGFVNEMSATSHYFKHRTVPKSKTVLSVSQYRDLILSLMKSVRNLREYEELERGERQRLCFDRVYEVYGGRRARLVLKRQNGKVVISSCHILEIAIPDEEDGYEEIDRDTKRFP